MTTNAQETLAYPVVCKEVKSIGAQLICTCERTPIHRLKLGDVLHKTKTPSVYKFFLENC